MSDEKSFKQYKDKQKKLLKLINEEWDIKLASHTPLSKPEPTKDGVDPKSIKRDKGKLTIGALNIHGLGKIEKGELKIDPKNPVGKLLTDRFDICVLSETWIPKGTDDGDLKQNGYTFVRADRRHAKKDPTEETKPNEKIGGGLLIYLSNDVNYKVRSIYEQNTVQFVHIEITNTGKPLHLVAIYSPSIDHYSHVISIMCQFLAAKSAGENIMFIGDFNIDLFGSKETGQKLFQLLLKAINNKPFEMHQLIKDVTHKVKENETCIDHIHTDIPTGESGIFDARKYSISTDHKGIFCAVEQKEGWKQQPFCETYISEAKEPYKFVEFIAELQDKIKSGNTCILSIFFKFEQEQAPTKEKVNAGEGINTFHQSHHVAIWATFASTTDIDSKYLELVEVVKEQNNLHKKRQKKKKKYMQTRPQCTIFTRDYTTDVYQSLQQRMWFKKWDAVWQHCFVDFLGVELEPTLTRPITVGDTVVSSKVSGRQAIALQNSFPRYYICKVPQCYVLCATEKDLLKHELETEHMRCGSCNKVYKDKIAEPIEPKQADKLRQIVVCNDCYDNIILSNTSSKLYVE